MDKIVTPLALLMPPRVEVGLGTLAKLADWISARNARRVLVVSDAYNAQRVSVLGLGESIHVFGDVRPEPDVDNLMLALAMVDTIVPDCVIGFGGGSAMDLAKLVRF